MAPFRSSRDRRYADLLRLPQVRKVCEAQLVRTRMEDLLVPGLGEESTKTILRRVLRREISGRVPYVIPHDVLVRWNEVHDGYLDFDYVVSGLYEIYIRSAMSANELPLTGTPVLVMTFPELPGLRLKKCAYHFVSDWSLD